MTPRLVTTEPAKLVKFLVRAFGATGTYIERTPSIIKIGDSIVMVSAAGPRESRAAFLHLYVDDADATYRRALEAGAISREEPWDTPYGDRRAMVTDPCGNGWQIATCFSPTTTS